MRLRNPLDSVLDKPTKVKVLRVLISPGLELTGREVALEARINHSACARTLRELTDMGLVTMRVRGRAHLYALRHDNVLVTKGLVPLFRSERSLMEEAIQYLQVRFGSRVLCAVLFGSYARGEEDHHSDLDILFLVDHDSNVDLLESRILEASSDFYRRFGAAVTPYVKSVGAFIKMRDEGAPLVQEIIRDGKDLFGRPLREVLRSGSHAPGRA